MAEYALALDCNVPRGAPDDWYRLDDAQQADMLAWAERLFGADQYFFRLELDVIDAPLARMWLWPKSIPTELDESGHQIRMRVVEKLLAEPLPESVCR